jgi:alpha-beta hydrolase superfamily lysophospholipase
MIDGLQQAYDKRGDQTIGVLAGPAIVGAQNVHGSMEEWLTHAVQVYLDRYPCLRVLLLGHSHGAVTADVVASRLEGRYASRIIEVVEVDRVEALYTGDTQARPRQVRAFNLYEHNGGVLRAAYDRRTPGTGTPAGSRR